MPNLPSILRFGARGLVGVLLASVVLHAACDGTVPVDELRRLQRQGRYEQTLEPLRELLESGETDSEIHLLYGIALARTGNPDVAVWSLRKAADDPRWEVRANTELASAALMAASWEEATEAAERVLEVDPDHLPARVIRGEAVLGAGKEPERALEDFERVLEEDPDNLTVKASIASALLMAGRVDEAARALEELEATAIENAADPSTQARLCASRAVLQAERGELDAAEARFEECLARLPDQPVLLESAVVFFDQRGRPERSTQLLEAALEKMPRATALRSKLAQRAMTRGDDEAAEAILRAGTEIDDPGVQSAAWTDLTNHFLARDDLSGAIASYERALALTEDPPPLAILMHADLLARAERHEEALEVAKDLENEAYRGLIEARVHLNEGRPARALARLDEVLPTWPNNAGARYYAARAAEQLGDFARAIEEYRQAIRSAPDQTEAALRLARLYLGAGFRQDAWNSGAQYFRAHPEDPEGVRVLLRSAAPSTSGSLQSLFTRIRPTPLWPVALATRADTIAERRGAEAALALIKEAENLDLTRPVNAELLRSKVVHLLSAERSDEAREAVDAALEASPDTGAFHEIKGLLLERTDAAVDAARAAYARAIELDPESWQALAALGRLSEAQGDSEEALAYYDRATRVHPQEPAPARRAAELALRTGGPAQAEKRLEALLEEHPWDAEAARRLTELRLARGLADDRTLELAERAVLFGGGEGTQPLLIEVHRARGETERANEVERAIAAGEPIPPKQIRGPQGS